jgi:CheY-like chemotaxis protein
VFLIESVADTCLQADFTERVVTFMRVMIVDDSPDVCQLHERLLRLMGHQSICLMDSREALSEARRFQPDVALLDICMPGMNGWDVAKQLRADPETRYIRLVAISALASTNDVTRSMQAGFDAHFSKPVGIKQWPSVLAAKSTFRS